MICISYCTSSSTIWPVFSLFLIFFRLVSRAFSRLKEKRNMRNMKNVDYVAAYAMRHNDTRGWEHYYHWRFEIPIGWKVSNYGVFSGLYFPAFGLNTERHVRIQSKCGKIRTRKNSVLGHFSRSEQFRKIRKVNWLLSE